MIDDTIYNDMVALECEMIQNVRFTATALAYIRDEHAVRCELGAGELSEQGAGDRECVACCGAYCTF